LILPNQDQPNLESFKGLIPKQSFRVQEEKNGPPERKMPCEIDVLSGAVSVVDSE
jgi:hypothetical protein